MSEKDARPISEASSPPAQVQLDVGGMTCAACQSAVQRALERTPGVTKATVSLMTNRAEVQYHPGDVSPEMLAQAVRNTGYEAE
ncbi:MAG: heavy-metal-associated domain-containing protein, partial [Bryobacterales bacterium]|nr:heavy-metal-associated domain-containing protein [Bryobacterales bacterium]